MNLRLVRSRLCTLLCVQVASIGAVMAQQPSASNSAQSSAATYTITDLGAGLSPQAINNSGEIVSVASVTEGLQAFLWENGQMTNLGNLGKANSSTAAAINNKRQVVGLSLTAADDGSHAFLWQDGKMTDLGSLPGHIGPGLGTTANGINDKGQVVGYSGHAFLWANGQMTDLGTLDSYSDSSEASAINAQGQVVGASFNAHDAHAFLWENGQMTDLGTLGGQDSYAVAINNSSQVVGRSSLAIAATRQHAFLWENGAIKELPPTNAWNSEASAINNEGQAVGSEESIAGASGVAVLWKDGEVVDLNTLIPSNSGWTLIGAYDINDQGQIVGDGVLADGKPHGFLLTPKYTVDASLQLSQSSFSFGAQRIGETTDPGEVWLHNSGPQAPVFASIQFMGGDAEDFAISENTCGSTLAPNATCSVTFTFTPTATGQRTSSLTFSDNVKDSPQVVAVSGIGQTSKGHALKFSNSSWQFPTRPVGETSGDYVMYIYNPSGPTVHFSSIQFTGGNAQEFTISRNTCGASLAPYTTCEVAFHFTPTAEGNRKTSLVFSDDATGSPQVVPVSGVASGPHALKLSNPSWQFPTRLLGETSGPYVMYLYNPGSPAIHFSSIQLSGGNAQDFAITQNGCGSNLAPYTTCAVAFYFAPIAVGERATSLIFTDDASNGPQVVPISGFGASK